MSEAFPAERRLQKRALFLEAQRVGVRVRASHFHFVVRRGSAGSAGRLGIVVTRKLGCAVVRNRVKRWCREVFRRTEPRLPAGTDLVAIVRGPAEALSFASTKAEWLGVWPLIMKRALESR